MVAYIIRRFFAAIFVTLFIIWFTFSLQYLQRPYGVLTPAYIACGTAHHTYLCLHPNEVKFGLLQNYFERMWQYVELIVVHFNFGFSYIQNQTVANILRTYIPRTFWLAFFSLILALVVALPLGIYQAWKRNSMFDYAATGTVFILYSVPAYVIGFVLLDIFTYHRAIFGLHLPGEPPPGVNATAIFTHPAGFILPLVTLAALSIAGLSRFMRSSVLDVLVQDYIRTARAKGCSPMRVLFRHTMRNALGPIVTILGLYIPALLGGALIVEEVFNYKGIGVETVYSISNNDTYTVLAITVILTVMTVVGNLLADLGLGIINPRVRIEASAS